MLNRVIEFFNENNLILNNKKFILAVSTGIDSIVMLDIFQKLKTDYNIEIIVAHVNHQVREESKIEEEYIIKYCLDNNIKCYTQKLNFENHNNFEAIAREKRYQFMFKLYEEIKADYLVLAHHANDNIETIIMRMLRGSSLTGYSGMQEVSNYNNKCIIRPLLNISKADIINYQKENELVYFEDITNSSLEYTRNRVRQNIIPVLFDECNDLINKFNDFRKTIFEASQIVNNERDEFINKNAFKNIDSLEINREEFLKLSSYLKQEVLFEILKEYKLSKVNITELIKIIESSKKNYSSWFKNKFMFVLEYNRIYISNNKKESKYNEIIIDDIGEYNITDNISIYVLKNVNKNDYNLNEIWYNSKSFPICIRTRKDGDKIKINGKTKKLKDLFIDLKIPVSKRNELLLCAKDNEILNVFGVCKSDILKEAKDTDIIITIKERANG